MLRGGPAPRLDALEREPVLEAPVPATPLGTATRESEWGLGFGPDVAAYVAAVSEVDLAPQEALDAWFSAYGDRYGSPYDNGAEVAPLIWRADDRIVTVHASEKIESAIAGEQLPAPTPGATVVTVTVSGAE
ncbi:hypothetical protein [Cellulomonas pakistanensis]|uniref:hypothetical protein n=1 Tax=Cellulomonas pakistanensis TaxID=992287 RepID=UPI001941FD87|nr:hypothetical protein [Cellulomonas pakistanensis]